MTSAEKNSVRSKEYLRIEIKMWNTIIIITVALLAAILILTYTWVEISSRNQEKNRRNHSGVR